MSLLLFDYLADYKLPEKKNKKAVSEVECLEANTSEVWLKLIKIVSIFVPKSSTQIYARSELRSEYKLTHALYANYTLSFGAIEKSN